MRMATLAKGVVLLALVAGLAGCAGTAKRNAIFWPPAPDLPRVQFLRSIKDSTEIVDQSAFGLLKVGSNQSTNIPFVKPYGIAVNKGKIYLTDTIPAEVLVIDLQGNSVSRLPGNVNGGKLKKPIGIAVSEDGNIFVADTTRLEVVQFDPAGNYVRSFGKDYNVKPVDVQVDADYVYLLDGAKSRLLVLDRNSGQLLRSIGQTGAENTRLSLPLALASDGSGGMYTTNFNGRVIEYDRDGHFLKGFGELGQNLNAFGRPRGIAVDRDGMVYIVDSAAQNTRIFDDKFRILMDFAGPGTRASLNVPAGIAVTTDNLDYYQKLAQPDFILDKVIFVVSQFGDNKISIFGLGKKGVDYDAEYRKIADAIASKEAEIKAKKKAEADKAAAGTPAASEQPKPEVK